MSCPPPGRKEFGFSPSSLTDTLLAGLRPLVQHNLLAHWKESDTIFVLQVDLTKQGHITLSEIAKPLKKHFDQTLNLIGKLHWSIVTSPR